MSALQFHVSLGSRHYALAPPRSLAPNLTFDGAAPRWFDAPAAHSWPHRVGEFSGTVLTGASCNCRNIQLLPHGNGTHSEGVGHLTYDEANVIDVLPKLPMPAVLLRLAALRAGDCHETADYAPEPNDWLVTQQICAAAWPQAPAPRPSVAVLALEPCETAVPPYLTRECTQWLVDRGIEHLIVELPSIDRLRDAGRLTAHRIFFGLPAYAATAPAPRHSDARRPQATVTELAQIPRELTTRSGFVQWLAPAMLGDAVPTQPLWYDLL
jgi:hypothetical protein